MEIDENIFTKLEEVKSILLTVQTIECSTCRHNRDSQCQMLMIALSGINGNIKDSLPRTVFITDNFVCACHQFN